MAFLIVWDSWRGADGRCSATPPHSGGVPGGCELVGRVEKAGLTRRLIDPLDRRRVLVSLTEAGEGVLAASSANNVRELRRYCAGLFGTPQLHRRHRCGAA